MPESITSRAYYFDEIECTNSPTLCMLKLSRKISVKEYISHVALISIKSTTDSTC